MKILITGGAGFIGSNFVRRSLAKRPGLEITVLDSLTYAGRLSNLNGLEDKITFIKGDICDMTLVFDLVEATDVVVHFAAESHNDNSLLEPEPFLRTNILGTYALIQAATKFRKRFHHVSTDEVFGDLPLKSIDKFKDSSPYNPSSPYSASKASSDHLVRAWCRSFGLKATISNCSNNFGPYQHEEKLIPRTAILAKNGYRPKIYGNGMNVRDWIHVDDHNDGIWAILDRGKIGQTYLLGSSNERSNIQVVSSILEYLNIDPGFVEHVDDRPGHDRRYAIDASKTYLELDWHPSLGCFDEQLPAVIDFYLGLDLDLSNIID